MKTLSPCWMIECLGNGMESYLKEGEEFFSISNVSFKKKIWFTFHNTLITLLCLIYSDVLMPGTNDRNQARERGRTDKWRENRQWESSGRWIAWLSGVCPWGWAGLLFFPGRRFCGLPSSHSTHRLKGFASGWHNECVCACVFELVHVWMHTREALWCGTWMWVWEWRGAVSLYMCTSLCECVCVFDVMFVHSVVAMASSLTPDAQENCVPIPFWPTESGR